MVLQSISCSSFSYMATLFWCASLLLVGWFPTAIPAGITIKGLETDRQALLAIRSQIDEDPFGFTSSWNNSVRLCQWKGITCGPKHQRVIMLDLNKQKLKGTLSPHVGNLSFLRFINLQENNFHGVIPPEIGKLPRLESLLLANNSFGGTIPVNVTRCSNLIEFVATRNYLVGNIPTEIGNLLKLEKLHIDKNMLTGELPTSLGNISTLQEISLSENKLQGRLLHTLGFLKRLVALELSLNQFSGLIPASFCNMSSLEILNIGGNNLHGSLPVSCRSNFPNLREFIISANQFNGPLPESLSNVSKLEKFDVSYNQFSGRVSINCQKALNLYWFNVQMNELGSGSDGDLDFITSLTNCSYLENLSIVENKFGGDLPNSIANLSTTIRFLYLRTNQITGTIPLGITNLVNLTILTLDNNQLTGTIPESIGKLKNLQRLDLGGNALTGRIPTSVGNLSLLTMIHLQEGQLEGSIPAEFGNCQNLFAMSLGYNRLTGHVPKEIFSIKTFSLYLDLSNNLLSGSVPSEIGSLKSLSQLDMSRNKFSGQVPATLGGCTNLQNLYLDHNQFHGGIPTTLSSLKSIAELDLSKNNLSGQIPKYLEKLSFLEYLNLSSNHFEGQVPTKGVFRNATAIDLTKNDKLCGGIAELHLPICHFNEPNKQKRTLALKLILIVGGVIGILLLSSFLLCWLRTRRVKAKPSSAFNLGNSTFMVSFQQLLKATNEFSSSNLIGQGSFGRVYKGILELDQERNLVAVKVINMQEQGASKSFLAECKTLRSVRHRNLVKIVSSCSSIDYQGNPFKALIYEFMASGSLEQWLHAPPETNATEDGESKILNIPQRLNIAIDVASALDYLHHQCEVAVIHCDLKPSNILLNHDMVAHVGDFGLARFFPKSMNTFSGNSTSITLGLRGTIGYAAPEYGMGTEATKSGDVYSFGILLLEIFTRKRPTDEMFKEGLTLHHFAKMAFPDQVLEIVDPLLLTRDNEVENTSRNRNPRRADMEENKVKECLVSILKVGIACSVESPNDRIDIVDAAKQLHFIRENFLGRRNRTQRQSPPQN